MWTEPPPGLREELADSFDGPGDVLLIDPNGVSVDLGTSPAVGLDASFADAVSHGADYFGSWQWLVGVVPGSSVEPVSYTHLDVYKRQLMQAVRAGVSIARSRTGGMP